MSKGYTDFQNTMALAGNQVIKHTALGMLRCDKFGRVAYPFLLCIKGAGSAHPEELP